MHFVSSATIDWTSQLSGSVPLILLQQLKAKNFPLLGDQNTITLFCFNILQAPGRGVGLAAITVLYTALESRDKHSKYLLHREQR